MSIFLQEELWVVVKESERSNAPVPRPLSSGFSLGRAYRVIGLHCPSETSEAYFILCNDRNEVWFISNQHFRVSQGEKFSRSETDGPKALSHAASEAPHQAVTNGRPRKVLLDAN